MAVATAPAQEAVAVLVTAEEVTVEEVEEVMGAAVRAVEVPSAAEGMEAEVALAMAVAPGAAAAVEAVAASETEVPGVV